MNLQNFSNNFFKRILTGFRFSPTRDWLILLSLSSVALIIIVLWNIYTFQTITGGGVIGKKVTRSAPVFDTTALDAARTIILNRAAEEEKYASGVYHFTDPSQ